jgi:putative Mn2+ efflux pump MntP
LGLSISLDEVAVGVSFALLGVPLIPAIVAILAQAFLFSLIGSSLGQGLSRRFGGAATPIAGLVLALLGFFQFGRIFLGW